MGIQQLAALAVKVAGDGQQRHHGPVVLQSVAMVSAVKRRPFCITAVSWPFSSRSMWESICSQADLGALGSLLKGGYIEHPLGAVHQRTGHAVGDHVLHDLDAHPGRADDQGAFDLALFQHPFQLYGILRRAHFEHAGQVNALQRRHDGGGAGADQNLVIPLLAAVGKPQNLPGRVQVGHGLFRVEMDVHLPDDLLQGAKGKQSLIGDRALDIIGGQHGVIRGDIRIAVNIYHSVAAGLADRLNGAEAGAAKSNHSNFFHCINPHGRSRSVRKPPASA